ncbi:MAG: hypothetical protein ACI9BW_002793 [Gammaproteobacteria bacterium]|jgi:hypothetical protein
MVVSPIGSQIAPHRKEFGVVNLAADVKEHSAIYSRNSLTKQYI